MIGWKKPNRGHFKLNVDGSKNDKGQIGAGGVIRNNEGVWCKGFMQHIGYGEVLQAEAWGLVTGLQIAVDMQIKHLDVESDSAILINLIQSKDIDLHPLGTLILNCRSLMNHFESCSIKHIHRERNMVADILAKHSLDNELGVCRMDTNPPFMNQVLMDDIDGLVRPRMVVTASVEQW
ncbi:putative ribonuclease H-like domain-containing protein [Rosa chinensis]|nr:putative ribonuclease H-like domain-containing protein [Rosa chinensis]